MTRGRLHVLAAAVALSVTLVACGTGSGSGGIAARGSPGPAEAPTTLPTTSVVTPAPAPTAPVANPWPLIGPAPAGHHVILGMGDSLLGNTDMTLESVLSAHGFDAVVYDAHVSGTGLLDRIDGLDVRQRLAQQLAAHPDVDTVIFEWLYACGPCDALGIPFGSTRFYAEWDAMARGLVLDAYARGLRVVWALSPPAPPDTTGAVPAEGWDNLAERPIVAEQLEANYRLLRTDLGVTLADWSAALSDTHGAYQRELWFDGALFEVRAGDLVHLSLAGSLRTATWTAAALAELYASGAGSH